VRNSPAVDRYGSGPFAHPMNRRRFLGGLGLAGAALFSAEALAACVQSATGQPTSSHLSAPPKGTQGGGPVVMRGWNYKVDVVQSDLKRFSDYYQENIDYQTVTGDFNSIITTMNITRQPLSFTYANPDTLARWSKSGWLHDFEAWWDVDKAKADMYPGWRDIATINGKLYGLPYFQSVRGTIVTNEVILGKVGINTSNYPTTYAELYDQCYQIKKAGAAKVPFLPHWFNAHYGLPWAFLFECQNQGAVVFDSKGTPVFDSHTYAILDQWRKLIVDGIAPPEVLTMTESDFIAAFASGAYAYSPQQTYDSKTFNDPSTSKIAGKSKYVKVVSQPWGGIDTGIYALAARPGDDDKSIARAMRLAGYFGYKDWEGQLYVLKTWAISAALNSGYKQILEDPDVLAAYKQWMPDYDYMFPAMNSLLEAVRSPAVWHRYFYDEWESQALTTLSQALVGDKPTKQALDELKTLAVQLVDRYDKIDPS